MHTWDRVRPRRAAAAFTALALSGAGLIGFAGVASAHSIHTSHLSGSVSVCQPDGTYTVTWTSLNDSPLGETVDYVSGTGGGSFVTSSVTISGEPAPPHMSGDLV
ncbi:MAG: hypothetical protein ACRDV3_10655, partial [Acidothermaceae bacterium]